MRTYWVHALQNPRGKGKGLGKRDMLSTAKGEVLSWPDPGRRVGSGAHLLRAAGNFWVLSFKVFN